jgi:HSP20 family protein
MSHQQETMEVSKMRTTIFDEMRRMQDDMDRMFNTFFSERWDNKMLTDSRTDNEENDSNELVPSLQVPKTDLWETNREIHVKVDLPGVDKKDITITPIDGGISIEANKMKEKEDRDEKKGYYRFERNSIGYRRMIPLPSIADTKKAKAKYKDGVLEIIMPKNESIKGNGRILIE